MGVKDLWPVLAPVGEELTLADLAGQRLAVDLSGWVCESCGAKGLASAVGKPYLRTLFFRVLTLYRLGTSLVFVVDGEAVRLKWAEMERRERGAGGRGAGARGRGSGTGTEGRWKRNTGTRPQFNSKIKECCDLLDLLGLPHLQSRGEAEAYCALLNRVGVVDGVLTQDSDSFPYGATVVYRDLSTNSQNPHLGRVDCYRMATIEKELGLTRNDLICLALLQGCDYCPQGVPGVGKETALKLVASCKSCDASCDLVERVRQWRDDSLEEDELSALEKKIRGKALAVPGFPNEEVIQEYMVAKDIIPSDTSKLLQWKMPQVAGLQSFCATHLDWTMEYTHGKAVFLLTQWLLRKESSSSSRPEIPIQPSSILHQRTRNRVACYEVKWEGDRTVGIVGEDSSTCTDGESSKVQFVTLENAQQFEASFPELCEKFRQEKESKKQKRKGRKKTRKLLEEDTQELSDSVKTLSIDVPRSDIDDSDKTATQTKKAAHTSYSSLCQHSRSHKLATEIEQQEIRSSTPVEIAAVDSSEVIIISEPVERSPGSGTAAVREKQCKARRTTVKSSPHKRFQNSGGCPPPVIDLEGCSSPYESSSDPEEELPCAKSPKPSPHKHFQHSCSGAHPPPVIDLESSRTPCESSSDPEEDLPCVKSSKSSPPKHFQNSGGRPPPVIDLEGYCTPCESSSDSEEELPLFARLKKNKTARQLRQPSNNFSAESPDHTEHKPKMATVATGGDVCILDSPTKKKKVSSSEAESVCTFGGMESPIVID